jgi:hypothetical protein
MLRRNVRLRKEYLYRKGLEGKERAAYERKRLIRKALEGACGQKMHLPPPGFLSSGREELRALMAKTMENAPGKGARRALADQRGPVMFRCQGSSLR